MPNLVSTILIATLFFCNFKWQDKLESMKFEILIKYTCDVFDLIK